MMPWCSLDPSRFNSKRNGYSTTSMRGKLLGLLGNSDHPHPCRVKSIAPISSPILSYKCQSHHRRIAHEIMDEREHIEARCLGRAVVLLGSEAATQHERSQHGIDHGDGRE